MITQRAVKKTSYAGGCILLLVAVVGGLSLWRAQPRFEPTPTPTPPRFAPIAVEQVDLVVHGTTADIVARLRNPNPRAGVAEYPLTFVLLNTNDQEFHRQSATTYILPGSVQYVVALEVPLTQPLRRVEALLPDNPTFQELPGVIDVPTFAAFARQSTVKNIGNRVVEEQKWVVRNTSTFSFKNVGVVALAHAADGRIIGIGTTLVGALGVGEQREVTLQWPAPAQPTARVTVFPSTNVFQEENIIRAIGDPSLLR